MEGLLRFYASTNGFYQGTTPVTPRGTQLYLSRFFPCFPGGGREWGKKVTLCHGDRNHVLRP